MLVQISRKVFRALMKDKETLEKYVSDTLADYELNSSELNEMIYGIITTVSKNEELYDEVGYEAYINETYTANKHVTGYFHRTGTLLLCPFDWSIDEKGEFDYSFYLARVF